MKRGDFSYGKFILAFDRELVIAEKDSIWSVQSQFVGANPVALAVDPYDPERMYCGTFDRGLWRSKDGEVHGMQLVRYLPLVKCSQLMLFI